MSFEDFIKSNDVRIASKDELLAKSLVKTAEKDLKFLENLEINENSSRKIMTNYYDVLRSVLEAMAAIKGLKIYNHEAFTYFLKEIGEEGISEKFDRFRKIRNRINYYGKDIAPEEANDSKEEIKKLIKLLINKYLKELR